MHIAFWIRIVVFVFMALFFVGLPLLLLVTSLLEKRGTNRLAPLPPERLKPWTAKLQKVLALAVPPSFEPLGVYSQDGRGQMAMFLSEDFSTILAVGQYVVGNYSFYTPIGDTMIVTSHTGSGVDLSNLELREMLPAENPEVVYRHHMDRVAASGEVPGIFHPDNFLEDIRQHELRRMHRAIELGLARPIGDDKWVSTFKGALKNAFSMHLNSKEIRKAGEDAKRKDKAYQAWAASQQRQRV